MSEVAIVTGGSRGLGEAIAYRLASMGYDIVITYARNAEMADAVVKRCKDEYGVSACAFQSDTSQYEACQKLVEDVVAKFGAENITVLVNNAGIEDQTPFVKKAVDVMTRVISVDLLGTMYMTHALLPVLYENRKGNIVNMASVGGLGPEIFMVDYCAAKHGVIGFTRALAAEAGRKNVRVNAVAPGVIDTDMIRNSPKEAVDNQLKAQALHRLGTPDEVADVVAFFIGNGFVTGQTVSPNGGVLMH